MAIKMNKNKKGKYAKKSRPEDIVHREKVVEKDPKVMPNTFKFAAETLKVMSERGGSAGSIVVGKYKSYNYKLIFALVMNTVKNIKIIKKIIHNIKLANQVTEDNPFLLEILVGDLLFGKGLKSIELNPTAAIILSRKDAIVKEQNILKKDFAVEDDSSAAKYLRVNHLKTDINHVISQLKTIGITQLDYSKDKIKFKKFINKFKTMESSQFMLDFHFPDDLVVLKQEAADRLKKTDLLKKNKVTLQDKASYMAVEALDVKPTNKIIDACFAPGCKTSLIATKLRNKGKILAYDIDKKRLIGAIRFLKLHGVTCVKPELLDFSKVKLRRLPKIHNVAHFDSILIDPSCSGSGIRSRVDYKKSDAEAGRLKKLQAFQVSLLKHAIKARISKTIVYCTCSTSVEENEQVIEMALNESGVKSHWEVDEIVPYWPSRGDSSYEFGSKCIRFDSSHLTNGFFVARLKCNKLCTAESDEAKEEAKGPPKQSIKAKPGATLKANKEEIEEDDDDDDVEDTEMLIKQEDDDDEEEEEEEEEEDSDEDDDQENEEEDEEEEDSDSEE